MFNLLQRAVGHATRVDNEKVRDHVSRYMIPGERIYMSFQVLRDMIIFTQHRIIIVDIKGVGIQKGIKTIPYKSITRFEIRTGGAVDINTELMIWIGYGSDPTYVIMFAHGDDNLYKVQKIIASALLLGEK